MAALGQNRAGERSEGLFQTQSWRHTWCIFRLPRGILVPETLLSESEKSEFITHLVTVCFYIQADFNAIHTFLLKNVSSSLFRILKFYSLVPKIEPVYRFASGKNRLGFKFSHSDRAFNSPITGIFSLRSLLCFWKRRNQKKKN